MRRSSNLVLLATMLGVVPAASQQLNISGAWNGNGTVTLPSGNREAVRCRATFRQTGNAATMSASCANASTRVAQSAQLTRDAANRFSGEFFNADYGISGSIRITVSGNAMNASMSGGGGSATFNLSR